MAFPLWADRLQSTLVATDAATRLEAMLAELNDAASGNVPLGEKVIPAKGAKRHYELKPVRRRHGF